MYELLEIFKRKTIYNNGIYSNLKNELLKLNENIRISILFNIIHMYINRFILAKKDEEIIYNFIYFLLKDLEYFMEEKNE